MLCRNHDGTCGFGIGRGKPNRSFHECTLQRLRYVEGKLMCTTLKNALKQFPWRRHNHPP